MTNQEILTKAITLAIENSWRPLENGIEIENPITDKVINNDPRLYIYSHDFAKALWGEDGVGLAQGGSGKLGWQYYLSHMVIATDPIKYLGENLKF